jgi:Fe-coproporphyrin III synthase
MQQPDFQLTHLPTLFLWPYSGCNCQCLMCDIWRDKSKTRLATQDVARLAPQWRKFGIRAVQVTGGEALMHADIEGILQELRRNRIDVYLFSSGISLKRHAAMVQRLCAGVTVSLDGPPLLHDEIRGIKGAYEKLRQGVAALKHIDRAFPVICRMTVSRQNYQALWQSVETAQDLGVDKISFLPIDLSTLAFNRTQGRLLETTNALSLSMAQIESLEAQIREIEHRYPDLIELGFVAQSPKALRQGLTGYFRAVAKGEFDGQGCSVPQTSAVVSFDGSVYPCFFIQQSYGRIGEGATFDEILNSPQALAIREGLKPEVNPVCQRCVCRQPPAARQGNGAGLPG